MNVLVIACHPDDEVLGVGGTILKHVASEDRVHVAMVTDGCSGVYDPGKTGIVAESMRRCAKHLGIAEIHELSLPNQKLDTLPVIELSQRLEKVIAEVKPEIVYMHAKNDVNQDHQALYRAGLIATRSYSNQGIKAVYLYEVLSSTDAGDAPFDPDYFVDIGPFLERKIEAFSFYGTEVKAPPHPRSLEAVRALASVRGLKVNLLAAEGFVTSWRKG